jgi:SAM-dependent methyltransferase
MANEAFEKFRDLFFQHASIFKKTFLEVESEFGDEWKKEFNDHLERFFGNDEEGYLNAVKGYTRFAIDAMRLQELFNKKLKYEDVSYEEACEKVYLNEQYMMTLYLPGILVSHFLWRHHYRQFLYYKKNFLPLLDEASQKEFYEVGTGSGFYSVQIFRHDPTFTGKGIEISPHSRAFTMKNLTGWGFDTRFQPKDINIIGANLDPLPFLQTIEVLEHLTDPELFLKHLRKLLKPGGYGFVTAALTAPNADHIYLYWGADDVIKQLQSAGFKVKDFIEEAAYEGQPGEYVPKVAAFIVT